MGKNVKSIGKDAFDACGYLKTVYYMGSEDDWSKINIGLNNSYLDNATIIYNYIV